MSENIDSNSPVQPDANQPSPAQNAGQTDPAPAPSAQLPEGLAEAFWDAEKNEVKLSDLITSHSDLSKFKTETEAKFANRPESADKYELRIPDSFKLPEGVDFEFDESSPLVEKARAIAFEAGWGQEGFDQLVSAYMQEKVASFQNDETMIEETYQAELAKLGERGKERIDAADTFLKGTLPENQYNAIKRVATTADGIAAIEALMALSKDKAPVMPSNSQNDGLSEADLNSMIKDPRYWRDKDPAFIQKVTDGYKKLYPNKVATSV